MIPVLASSLLRPVFFLAALGSAMLATAPVALAEQSHQPNTASTSLAHAPLVLVTSDAPSPAQDAQTRLEAASPEAIIMAQIAAISDEKWEEAFSFATAKIRSQFGTPQRFAAMVQGGFAFMIAPASTELSVLGATDSSALVEAVFISDTFGVRRVIYSLERDADNSWRIAGVLPDETPDLAA